MVSNVLSAGFLFYSHPPDSEDVYFLLGMDDYNCKWSDFGGRRNVNESELDCAIREMVEETMFTVQIREPDPVKQDIQKELMNPSGTVEEYVQQVKKMIETKNYTYRIGLDITPRSEKKTIVSHGFDLSTLSVYYVCPFTHLDKIQSNQPLSSDVQHSHPLSKSLKRLRVCYVKYIPWQPNLPQIFSKTYESIYRLNALSTLDEKIEYYNVTLPPELRSHPAIHIERQDGKITHLSVLKEWIEKQKIAWWSLPRLKHALKNGGRYKRHILRYGFLSTLGIILERFSKPKLSSTTSRFLCDMHGTFNMEILKHALLSNCVCGHHLFDPLPSLPSIPSITF